MSKTQFLMASALVMTLGGCGEGSIGGAPVAAAPAPTPAPSTPTPTPVASKDVSGTVFLRDENVVYAANSSGTGLAGASVSSGSASATTSGGAYSIRVPQQLLATDQFDVSMSGYVPISINRSLIDGGSFLGNFGLYKAPAVQPKPGFVTGVFTMDSGGFLPGVFANNLIAPTYSRIANRTGANLVAISDPAWLTKSDPATNTVEMKSDYSIPMLNDAQYATLTTLATAQNLKFMMQIGIYNAPSADMPWNVSGNNKAFWNAWFAAYKPLVLRQIAFAIKYNIEYVSLGMNAGYMTEVDVQYWKDLINAVRASGYKGKIVYQAIADLSHGAYESTNFNAFSADATASLKAKNIEFVRLFDDIIIDVYAAGAASGGGSSTSRASIVTNFKTMLNTLSDYPVPLMIMIGTPSTEDGATSTDFIEPCVICSSLAPTKRMDLFAQADVYEAALEAINDGQTGNGHVNGLLTWGYWYHDNYWLQDATHPIVNADGTLVNYVGTKDEGAFNKSADIRGKPAESIMQWWAQKYAGK